MIQQAAPIVAMALLKSLCAGAICYVMLRAILAIAKNRLPIILYHLCNIVLIVPLVFFIWPILTIGTISSTAPILPADPVTIINNEITAPYTPGTVTNVTTPGVSIESLWSKINFFIAAYSNAIMLLYIAGLLLFLLRLLLQYVESARMRRIAILPASAMWLGLLDSTRHKLGINRRISLSFTTSNISPCIIGHTKAIILIPVSIANNLTTEQAEAILLHELAHYKHYDHYLNIITQCINCILFFNPFAWLITQQANHYRELACDAAATNNDRHIELAETLAIIARMQIRENALSLNAGKGRLLTRIQMLLKITPEPKRNRFAPISIAAIAMTLLLLFAGSYKMFSTEKDDLRNRLKEISHKMFEEGNFRYVFVDAVLDSLVRLPFKAEVLYLGDQYWSMNVNNGYKPITQAQQLRYKEKLQDFLKTTGEDAETPVHFFALPNNNSLMLNDILAPTSSFRTITPADKYKAGLTHKAWTLIFSSMLADGLVSHDMDKFNMSYDNNGIIINNIELTDKMNERYRIMFKDILGLDLDKNSVSGELSMSDLRKYLVAYQDGSTNNQYSNTGKQIYAHIKLIRSEMHKDGLLDTNFKSVIIYRPDFIAINNYILSPILALKYVKMYREKGKLLQSDDNYNDIIADKPKLNYPDINTIKGKAMLRKADKLQTAIIENMLKNFEHSEREANKTTDAGSDKLIQATMHQDGLLDTNYKTMIIYTPNEIWVNEHLLAKAMKQKYTLLFQEQNKNLVGHNDFSVIIAANEKKAYPLPASLTGKRHLLKPNSEQKKHLDKMLVKHEKDMQQHEAALVQHEKALEQHYKALEQHEKDLAQHERDMQQYEKDMEQHERDLLQHEKDLEEHIKNNENQKANDKKYKALIKSMQDDKLINENSYYLVEYETNGIYVNARKLEGAMARKYEQIFRANGYKKGQLITERIPDGLAVPDWKEGNSTVHLYTYGNNLPAIAEKMFTEGNPNFILAYALQDKLLKESERYNLSYNRGIVLFQNKPLKEPFASKYNRLMADFFKAHGKTDNYRMSGNGVTIKALNTPTAPIRKERLIASNTKGNLSYYLTQAIKMMNKDGVIDTTKAHSIKYNSRGVFVNNKKLEDNIAARYEPLLQKSHGSKPRGYLSGDGSSYSSKP